MEDIIAFNAILILAVFLLTLMMVMGNVAMDAFERVWVAVSMAAGVAFLSFFGWMFYIILHFIMKYW